MQACVRTAKRRDTDPRRAHGNRCAAALGRSVDVVAVLAKADALTSTRA